MLQPVWAENEYNEMNRTLAFTCDVKVKKGDKITVSVTASDIYKMFLQDVLIGYGPARGAHGYVRVDVYEFTALSDTLIITAEAVSYRINSYYLINRPPFFACEIRVNGAVVKTSADFECFLLNDRVRKIQRYSFQRPFAEGYKIISDRKDFYLRKSNVYQKRATVPVNCDCVQTGRGVAMPELGEYNNFTLCESGNAQFDFTRPVWQDRSLVDIGETLLGYRYEECEIKLSDDASRLVYEKDRKGNNPYLLYAAEKCVSGLINVKLKVDAPCRLYIMFDELLGEEERGGARKLDPFRNECCNVISYDLPAGEHCLSSFEIYTLKYIKAVCVGANMSDFVASVTEIKNPEGANFRFFVNDEKITAILKAAVNTFEQNTLDLLMDCPSRERAGWTNDSFFTCDAELTITGENRAETNFLENLLLADEFEGIPKGMFPMCYPCDHPNGNFVPNCGIWVALQMCKHLRRYPAWELRGRMKEKIYGLIKYFDKYLNSDGLLENLDGWIFIEWSKANDSDYVAGVNYPSNMMYYKLLAEIAAVFADGELAQRARRVKSEILRQSFNGEYFEDNRVRENGELVLKGHLTETCQYYAFYFDVADKNEFGELYSKLMRNFGFRNPRADSRLAPSNIIIGIILRQELHMRDANATAIIEECKRIFYPMSEKTGTLWEHTESTASCNHGIASVTAKWLLFALTGYSDENGAGQTKSVPLNTDCSFTVRRGDKDVTITVKNGKLEVQTRRIANAAETA